MTERHHTSVLNGDLYRRTAEYPNLCIVARSPRAVADGWIVTVDLRQTAAAIAPGQSGHLEQTLVDDIRRGKDGLWLLSGGTIVTDHLGRIAIGLRDGNAADPFAFTNIGAGRCDRRLHEHCLEEFHSELVLCVKDRGGHWMQVKFDPATPDLADVRSRRPGIARFRPDVGQPQVLDGDASLWQVLKGPVTVTVEWTADDHVDPEVLSGHVLVDERHHTFEFRLPLQLNLARFEDTVIFYPEGTGYGLWRTPAQIRELASVQRSFGATLVAPLLEAFVAREPAG